MAGLDAKVLFRYFYVIRPKTFSDIWDGYFMQKLRCRRNSSSVLLYSKMYERWAINPDFYLFKE